ncbi:MAG: DUF4065 domain-containing protein [Candidatus Gracilibacteria bacterium]|nr:DUF4065 domain-containing protein [Candidatus Gracilibacteria bacterium]
MENIKYNEILKKLREDAGYSQVQLANMLEISRVSVAHIEMGIRKVKAEDLKKYSQIFDVNIDFILGNTDETKTINEYDKAKFNELLLYILEKCGAKYNVGKTVLYKLLYFSEFDYFELYNKHISGISFVKLPKGPAPFGFDFIIKDLEQKQEIIKIVAPYGNYFQERYIPNRRVDDTLFSIEEKQVMDDVIERYSNHSAQVISDLSHEDLPWKMSKDMNVIDYSLVRNRQYPFSPVSRQKKKKETQDFAKMTGFFNDLANEPDLYEEYR